jgi:hypothetical protein
LLPVGGHAFISYAHGPDGEYVDRLAAFLTAAGVLVRFDREIVTGSRWEQVICVFRHGDIQYEDVVGGRMPGEAFVAGLRELLDWRAETPKPPRCPSCFAGIRYFPRHSRCPGPSCSVAILSPLTR